MSSGRRQNGHKMNHTDEKHTQVLASEASQAQTSDNLLFETMSLY